LGDVLGRLALAGTRVVAVVAGVDPDELAAEVHDLVLAGDVPGRVGPAHVRPPARSRWWVPPSSPLGARAPSPVPAGRRGAGRIAAAGRATRRGDRPPLNTW